LCGSRCPVKYLVQARAIHGGVAAVNAELTGGFDKSCLPMILPRALEKAFASGYCRPV